MVRTVISVDLKQSAFDQKTVLHNRWHPDIPAVATVKEGEPFRVECMDWTGRQIKNDDDATDVKNLDMARLHVLSGPISVEGAEPGDSLEVEILDIQPLPGDEWGFTAILSPEQGGTFLARPYEIQKAIWDINGIYATSRHIPGVKFAGLIHPGILGTAPSQEMLDQWNQREQELIDSNPHRIPALAWPPNVSSAIVGNLQGLMAEKIMKEGARTVPPRENGGNCDIKNLSRGSKIWFPVWVPGAKLSVGDIHFSQGDGEIAFCGAIEMSGAVTMSVKVIKDGMKDLALKTPIFLPGPESPRFEKYLTFEGISVDESGKQRYLDASTSFRYACFRALDYFKKFGYTEEQVMIILSAAPCESRIASIVDTPNACCTIGIPTDIFEFDILPNTGGPVSAPRGKTASVLPQNN